jgi:3-hydroxybutyryl-CoA dehydratase
VTADTAADLTFDSLHEGDTFEQSYVIDKEVYEHFLAAFHDRSPVHVDEAYAHTRGFAGRVMHGTILNGFVSQFVGMHVPGRPALLLSVDLQYTAPCYLGDRLTLRARLAQKVDTLQAIVLHLQFHNVTQNVIAARGRAQVQISKPS